MRLMHAVDALIEPAEIVLDAGHGAKDLVLDVAHVRLGDVSLGNMELVVGT